MSDPRPTMPGCSHTSPAPRTGDAAQCGCVTQTATSSTSARRRDDQAPVLVCTRRKPCKVPQRAMAGTIPVRGPGRGRCRGRSPGRRTASRACDEDGRPDRGPAGSRRAGAGAGAGFQRSDVGRVNHAARARRDGAGQKQPSAVWPQSRTITGRADRGAGSPRRSSWPANRDKASVVAGQRGDSPQFEPVLVATREPRTRDGRSRTRPLRVRDDKAYPSRADRAHLHRRGIRCTIPEPADQVRNRKRRGREGDRPQGKEGSPAVCAGQAVGSWSPGRRGPAPRTVAPA